MFLSSKLREWETFQNLIQNSSFGFIKNPLNAFVLIKHFAIDFKIIKNQLLDTEKQFFESSLVKSFDLGESELLEAVESLLRLQTTYKFKSTEFANGIIDGQKIRPALSTHDLFVIGGEAFKLNQDYFSQEYFNLAWERINLGMFDEKEVDDRFLMLRLISSYNRTGYFSKAVSTVETLVKKYPEHKKLLEAKTVFETYQNKFGLSKVAIKDPFVENFVKNGKFNDEKEEIVYSQACRDSFKRPSKDESRLKCGLVYLYKNPFTRLAQFKVEEVNMNPYVIIYHDILSDHEMELLKEMSKSKVRWAVKTSGANVKLAKNAWLSAERNNEMIKRISQRIEVS